MSNQEILEQIDELHKQQGLLIKQGKAIENKIKQLQEEITPELSINSYYTDSNGLFCKVYDFSAEEICAIELSIVDYYITEEIYTFKEFKDFYSKECSKEEYNKALNIVINHFKD